MFGRGNDGGGPPTPPGQDSAGDPVAVPEVPPGRQYRVRRFNPFSTSDEDKYLVIELTAHEVELNAGGNVLRFRQFYMCPVEGPTNRIVKCFNGWFDYEDITPPRERSLIIQGESIH